MEEEIFEILNKKKDVTQEELCRLTELFSESQRIDKGKSYVNAYNKFIISMTTQKT